MSDSDPIFISITDSGGPLPISLTQEMVDAFGWGWDIVDKHAVRPLQPGARRALGLQEVIPVIQHATLHEFARFLMESVEAPPEEAESEEDLAEFQEFLGKAAVVATQMACSLFDEYLTDQRKHRAEHKDVLYAPAPEPGGYL